MEVECNFLFFAHDFNFLIIFKQTNHIITLPLVKNIKLKKIIITINIKRVDENKMSVRLNIIIMHNIPTLFVRVVYFMYIFLYFFIYYQQHLL